MLPSLLLLLSPRPSLRLAIPVALTLTFSSVTITHVSAILVNANSPTCAPLCGNSLDATVGSEITCRDADYASSLYGATFKTCIACELASDYVDPATNISDLAYGLYNLRFALSWCLFDWESNNQTTAYGPCLTSFSCAPTQAAFEYDDLDPAKAGDMYAFCGTLGTLSPPKCADCIFELGGNDYISNFVTALEGACLLQPKSGSSLTIQGSVFSQTKINVTEPSASPTGSFSPHHSPLGLGGKIGIAVGALIVVLVLSGCLIVWRGKRRRRAFLGEKARLADGGYGWARIDGPQMAGGLRVNPNMGPANPNESPRMDSASTGPFFDSPASQRPFANAWTRQEDNTPTHGTGGFGQPDKVYFSPYTSPVSASDAIPVAGNEWPRDRKASTSGVQQREEEIEMENVSGGGNVQQTRESWRAPVNETPILQHPGYGRGSPGTTPPGTGDVPRHLLTDEEVKNGRAL